MGAYSYGYTLSSENIYTARGLGGGDTRAPPGAAGGGPSPRQLAAVCLRAGSGGGHAGRGGPHVGHGVRAADTSHPQAMPQ
eukprot:3445583-Pyramimonas_sp.AAC.1